MPNITLSLDTQEAHSVAFDIILDTLITMKQYIDEPDLYSYKFMLGQFATPIQLTEARITFDKAWPTDIKWDDI